MTFSLNLEPFAKATLQKLADKLELQTDLDVELQGTQLTICDNLQQTFLLNFHSPTNQLWLSSPLTGAHHFILDNGVWISTRSQISLTEILSFDICQLFKDSVNL
jgi:iron donor protein CyaY